MFFIGLAVLWARAPTAHADASSTPLSWEAARAEAQALVAQMSAVEKASLMNGPSEELYTFHFARYCS